MSVEKIQAQIIAEVDDASFQRAGDKTKAFARDTWKELDKSMLFKLQLDKANTKIQLDNARKLLRQAKKDWDKALELKMTLKTQALQSKLTEAGRKLNNFVNTGNKKLSRLWKHFESLKTNVWGLIGKLWLVAVAMWAFKAWSSAIELWDRLEQATISFTTMLWSAKEAKSLLQDLAIFASNTPFELLWLRDTAKQLIAFWIENKNIIPTLKALWDVSAWLSVPIEQVAYAYGQVKVAGRLMGQELMQFTNAGVPLIAELSKNLWVAQKDIKKMVSQGKIWFADVQQAFKTMSSEWWKFANMMDKQTETLTWKWSNLQDTADMMLEKIGTALLPFAKKAVDAMAFALDWFGKIILWLRWVYELMVSWIVQSIFHIQKAWNTVITNVQILFNGFIWTFRDFWVNVGIFVRNTGKVFLSLPHYIGVALDKWITQIESFLNKASNWINAFAKKLWFKWDLAWKVKLGRISSEDWAPTLEKFKDINRKAAALKNLELLREKKEYDKSRNDLLSSEKNRLSKELIELWKANGVAKKLNTEMIINRNNATKSVSETQKAAAKAKKEADKAEIARIKKYNKYLDEKSKKEENRIKSIEKWKSLVKSFYNNINSEIDKSSAKIDKFNTSIEWSMNKIKDLQNALANNKNDTGVALFQRKLDLEKQIRDLEDSNRWIGVTAWRFKKSTLQQIWTGTIWWISWNDLLAYKKLVEEKQLIDQNANLISEENKKVAQQNDTEKLLAEFTAKQEKIQQDIKDEQDKLKRTEENKNKEQEILAQLNEYRTNLETTYTSVVQAEVQKRIWILEKMRQKAIETANAMAKAWITTNHNTTNNNVNVNLKGTWFSNVDAQNIGNTLVPHLNNAAKWINN